MNYSITTSNHLDKATFFEVWQYLVNHHFMDSEENNQMQIAMFALFKEQVITYNHKRTTTISNPKYKQIVNSVYYALDHAPTFKKDPLTAIKANNIKNLYEEGKQVLQAMQESIFDAYGLLKKESLPIQNERYHDVINNQLLYFYHEYSIDYRATFCRQDLDYPLLDGLPLIHHMYNLKGVDLVQEYARRLLLEQRFCLQYTQEAIIDLFCAYEIQKGISITYLGINLLEIILNQQLFLFLLPNHKTSLVIDENEIDYLTHVLKSTKQTINAMFQHVHDNSDEEMYFYLLKYKPTLQSNIEIAIANNAIEDLFIHHSPTQKKFTFQDKPSYSNVELQRLLEKLSYTQDRITFLLSQTLSLIDLIDILNMGILTLEELTSLFHQMDLFTIAILLKYLYPEEFTFHQVIPIDKNTFHTLAKEYDWQTLFLDSILEKNAADQVKLHDVLLQIE